MVGYEGALTLTEKPTSTARPAPNNPRPPTPYLIRRMAEDDVDALAVLFDRYRVPVYRAALALTGDPGASEEVLLDTFGRAYTTGGACAPTSRRCRGCTRSR